MSREDKARWNNKYRNNPAPTNVVEVVEKYAKFATGNRALDIASGMGRNSKFLAKNAFVVDALDISSIAIEKLQDIENINAIEVDFDTYTLKKNSYDLIVCTYYLNRDLFPQIENALKENGIFIFETFVHHPDNSKVPSNKSFLLNEGEMKATFDGRYELLYIREFMEEGLCGEKSRRASMVAKKINIIN